MCKGRWSPTYYTKKDIVEMSDDVLVDVFEQCSYDVSLSTTLCKGIPKKLSKQHLWIRNELLTRLQSTA